MRGFSEMGWVREVQGKRYGCSPTVQLSPSCSDHFGGENTCWLDYFAVTVAGLLDNPADGRPIFGA